MDVMRLNRVISLVKAFEELSHMMSLFCSPDKVKRAICLFHKQVFELSRCGGSFFSSKHMGLSSLLFQT